MTTNNSANIRHMNLVAAVAAIRQGRRVFVAGVGDIVDAKETASGLLKVKTAAGAELKLRRATGVWVF